MGGVISVLRIFSKRLLKMLVFFASLALIGGTTALVLPDALTQEFVAKNQTTVEDLIQFEADRLNDPLDPLGDLLSKGGNPLNPGPYTFGFISGDSAHTETRKADGTVEGRYIFVNQEGKVKQVAYVSNSSGFYPLNEADSDFSFLPSSAPSATSVLPVLPLHEALLPEITPTSLPPTAPESFLATSPTLSTKSASSTTEATTTTTTEGTTNSSAAAEVDTVSFTATEETTPASSTEPSLSSTTGFGGHPIRDTEDVERAKKLHAEAMERARRDHAKGVHPVTDTPEVRRAKEFHASGVHPVRDTEDVRRAKQKHFHAKLFNKQKKLKKAGRTKLSFDKVFDRFFV